MSWRALVPIKPTAERKSRLASRLSPLERAQLTDAMLRHVLGVIERTETITELCVLSSEPIQGWDGRRIDDLGRGLNVELDHAARLIGHPLLVIHADLPLLAGDDVTAILSAAQEYGAIAPDRHGTGTNALALQDATRFPFSFGRESFSRHIKAAGSALQVVRRHGLALDVDEPADFDAVATAMRLMQCDSEVRDIVMSAPGVAAPGTPSAQRSGQA